MIAHRRLLMAMGALALAASPPHAVARDARPRERDEPDAPPEPKRDVAVAPKAERAPPKSTAQFKTICPTARAIEEKRRAKLLSNPERGEG